MARYIDADALREYVEKTDWYSIHGKNMIAGAENSEKAWYKATDIYAAIEIAPTIEAHPVVRGEWIKPYINFYGHPCHCCSVCGFKASWQDKNFCPECGADMRGAAANE